MIVKFEVTTQRVKGLSFHNKKPWILATLHTGTIQLWDYRIGVLVDKFEEHEGPVRGVNFHPNQPIFITGGDDFKIKGWNYKLRKSIFTITGHLDYIRTVQFHHELPWILSTSDDQTIRIWNWQNRQMITILTGHSNYVMCAQFHLIDDLIVSCSLDQTIRIWDFSKLRKKGNLNVGGLGAKPKMADISGIDVEVRAVIDAHERGVNWASFHPTLNLIVSGADDRKIRLWKYTETKAWEHDTLYGHSNNISCVVFHPNLNIFISNSEDKTIRVWDSERRCLIDTFRKEVDRYWMLAAHPTLNYIAAGSDSSISVFLFERERLPSVTVGDLVFYATKTCLKCYDIKTKKEYKIKVYEHVSSSNSLIYQKPTHISYNYFNTQKHVIQITFDDKNKIFIKNYIFEFDLNFREQSPIKASVKYYYSRAIVFIGKNRVLNFSDAQGLEILDLENLQSVATLSAVTNVQAILPATLGKAIIKQEEGIALYDTTAKKNISTLEETELNNLKRAVWNSNFSLCALISKKNIVIVNKSLHKLTLISEKFSINSAIWTSENVLLYSTINQVKYALYNGEVGIILCIPSKRYLLKYVKETKELIYLNTNDEIHTEILKSDEFSFKMAILQNDTGKIKSLLKSLPPKGNSIISYLYRLKYPGLALNMVSDPQAKLSLALDSGNLEVAYKTALELNNPKLFARLAEEALRQGNQQIVEVCYQKMRDYDKLSFLYLVTGNITKLQKMLIIAQNRGDLMSRFQNSLYLGDVQERVKVLAESGQLPLAYICAVNHGLKDLAAPLKNSIGEILPHLKLDTPTQALFPPRPVFTNINNSKLAQSQWPHQEIDEEEIYMPTTLNLDNEDSAEVTVEETNAFGTDSLAQAIKTKESAPEEIKEVKAEKAEKAWNIEDDIDLSDEEEVPAVAPTQSTTVSHFQNVQSLIISYVKNTSQLIGEHVSAGLFDSASALLNRQLGVTNIEPLKLIMLNLHEAAQLNLPNFPFLKPIKLIRPSPDTENRPFIAINPQLLTVDLQRGYQAFNEKKLADAENIFLQILYHIPFLVLKNSALENQIKDLQKICLSYLLVLKLLDAKNKKQENSDDFLKLSLLISCCNLQPTHQYLMLYSTLLVMHKTSNFIFTVYLARKILNLYEEFPSCMSAENVIKIKKALTSAEAKGKNVTTITMDEKDLYDSGFVYKINSKSLKKINKNSKSCPFCGAMYEEEDTGPCCVCKVGNLGAQCIGLKLY